MDAQAVLNSIDELVFQQTGKHLNSLQLEILKGVFNGQKYAEIAERYKCTPGHVKDEGYELWQVLSQILGEELNKSNFCSTIERLGIANSHSRLVNPIQIGNLNLCANSEAAESESWDGVNIESSRQNTRSPDRTLEKVLRTAKLKSVSNFIKLGLTTEQIAEALDLPLHEVQQAME